MARITVTPLGFALGAEITGIDLRQPLHDLARQEILDAWRRHLVLVFPGQQLDAAQHMAFSANFGTLDRNDFQPHYRDPLHPEILLVTNRPTTDGKPSETRNTGRNWHTDLTYTIRPAKAALLLCKEKPPVGGDTMFTNLYLAYETLSPKLRGFLDTLEAIHDVSLIKGIEKRDPEKVADLKRRNPPVAHPVVRTHPETGRKSLLIGQRIRGFVDMAEEESAPLLAFLNDHATSSEFVYRHRWRLDDLVMWDNRCTSHVALPDFDQTRTRHMMRCSLIGEEVGRYLEHDVSTDKEEALMKAVAAIS
jgi:taurine dioxygenase